MAFSISAWQQELLAIPRAAWPDCKSGGLWLAERVSLEPFANLDPPFSVVTISTPTRLRGENEWGIANLTLTSMVSFWRVATTDGDDSAFTLSAKLDDMINYLWPGNVLTTGQVMGVESVSWSDDLPPNIQFRASNLSQRAGVVTAHTIVGAAQ